MSVSQVVTGGYGNGSLITNIGFVVTRGYSIGAALAGLDDFEGVMTIATSTPLKTNESSTGKISITTQSRITLG